MHHRFHCLTWYKANSNFYFYLWYEYISLKTKTRLTDHSYHLKFKILNKNDLVVMKPKIGIAFLLVFLVNKERQQN
jgi:hypothetical protein